MSAAAFLAEISGAGGRGSGLLVAPRIILTAGHVLVGPAASVFPAGVSAKVRIRQDVGAAAVELGPGYRADPAALARDPAMRWRVAELVWPPAGADVHAQDIALLRIEKWDEAEPAPEPGTLAALRPPAGRLDGVAYGFPRFMSEGEDEEKIWQPYEALGDVRRSLVNPRTRTQAFTVNSETPKVDDDWKGMSGAVLMLNEEVWGRIFGIVHARASNVHANRRLDYWPLANIPPGDPFWDLSGIAPPAAAAPAAAPGGRPVQPVAATLRESFLWFDRSLVDNAFMQWIAGDQPGAAPSLNRVGPPRRPGAVVVRGHLVDEPALCLARFAEIFATAAFSRRGANYRIPVMLRCGPYDDLPDNRIYRVLGDWARRYGNESLDLEARRAAILAGLHDDDKPRLIVLEHDTDRFVEGCSRVVDKVLGLVEEAWQAGGEGDAPPVVILSLITGENAAPRDAGYDPAEYFAGKEEAFLAEIGKLQARHPGLEWSTAIAGLDREKARPEDVDIWLEGLVRRGIAVPPAFGDSVKSNLGDIERFRMRYAKAAADRALAALGD